MRTPTKEEREKIVSMLKAGEPVIMIKYQTKINNSIIAQIRKEENIQPVKRVEIHVKLKGRKEYYADRDYYKSNRWGEE